MTTADAASELSAVIHDVARDVARQEVASLCELVLRRLQSLSPGGIDWHSHDGMVTVYDRDGRYMGCMGVERFHRLLAEDVFVEQTWLSEDSDPAKERDA